MLSTVGAAVMGWALLRLVVGESRQPRTSMAAAPRQSVSTSAGQAAGFGGKQHAPAQAAHEKERGREASTPTQTPSLGWKDILWRTWEEFGQDRIMSVAAGVTYYALLAVFPAIAALVSIYGLFADPAIVQDHLNTLSGALPGGAMEIISDQVKRIASKGGGVLGLSSIIGLAISLWSANAGMTAIFDALNIVYDEEEKRGFLWLNAQSLTFTLAAIAFVLIALIGIIVLPVVLDFIGLRSSVEWLLSLARWPILRAAVIAGLAMLYRYSPSRDKADWKWVTPGGIVAAVLWLVGSILFSWYVANFGSYNETYGSLGAVIGFMTWIWLSSIIVLLGAEINAEMEHQTAQDTTTGPPRPLGARGATMADNIGPAKA
jgi:membrane protein